MKGGLGLDEVECERECIVCTAKGKKKQSYSTLVRQHGRLQQISSRFSHGLNCKQSEYSTVDGICTVHIIVSSYFYPRDGLFHVCTCTYTYSSENTLEKLFGRLQQTSMATDRRLGQPDSVCSNVGFYRLRLYVCSPII